jgi:alpha-amylase
MTEWVLPSARLVEYQDTINKTAHEPVAQRLRPFVRAGGSWRNFKAKYPESDEMYARMIGLSDRLAVLSQSVDADPDYLALARDGLYRAQCNCAYWHGAFGGLYLPHLRNAIYRQLILTHDALDEAEGRTGPRVSIDAADFNLDARQEVRLENDRLIAFVRPAQGGHVYELDVRSAGSNVLATLDRRPEAYHAAIAAAYATNSDAYDGPPSILNKVVLKQDGLNHLLVYDRHPRKALVDHFLPLDATLDDLKTCRDIERGDFVNGTYFSKIQRGPSGVTLVMERPGLADGHPIQIRKTISIEADSGTLDVLYVLEKLPIGIPLHFAVEINLAAMAGHAQDRFYDDLQGRRLGMLDARLDLASTDGVNLRDEWLDLAVGLGWSKPASLWCFPIETVSQSEGGFEGVYQSSAVVPRWVVQADESGKWEVRIRWSLGPARAERDLPTPVTRERLMVDG